MDYILTMQKVWHWAANHDPQPLEAFDLRHHLDLYVWANHAQFQTVLRLLHFDRPSEPVFAIANQWFDSNFLSHISAPYAHVDFV